MLLHEIFKTTVFGLGFAFGPKGGGGGWCHQQLDGATHHSRGLHDDLGVSTGLHLQ